METYRTLKESGGGLPQAEELSAWTGSSLPSCEAFIAQIDLGEPDE